MAIFSPETKPAKVLTPGLLAVVLFSSIASVLLTMYGELQEDGLPQGLEASRSTLAVIAGIFGAFGGFFAVLLNGLLVWIYGKATQATNENFVHVLAVVAVALGVTKLLQVVVYGIDILMNGVVSTTTLVDLSRYTDSVPGGLNLLSLLTIVVIYLGSRRYLNYTPLTAGILFVILLFVNFGTGILFDVDA